MSTTSLNRFTNYPNPNPTTDKMNFWSGIEHQQYQHRRASDVHDNSEDDYETDPEDNSALIVDAPVAAPKKRKAEDELEPTIDHIKRIATGDAALTARVKAFYDALLEEKRKLIGDEIFWQAEDDEANKAALLDGNINVIMQARKAMMSKDDEGVSITIEQGGWNDKAHVRPKYTIVIKRIHPPSE